MKKLYTFVLTFMVGHLLCYSQIPGILWQKALGGTDVDYALGITETTDGNYVVTGIAASNNGDFIENNGQDDIWLVKLTPDGDIVWKVVLGGSQKDWVEYIDNTADGGVVISGSTYSNDGDIPASAPDKKILAAKFDSDGNLVWIKVFEGLTGQSIVETSDGGYLLAGERYSPFNGTPVSYDALLIKLDINGNTEWLQTYGLGGTAADLAWRAKEISDGNYVFGGSSLADVWMVKVSSTDGTMLWQKFYGTSTFDDFNDFVETPDGDFMVACSSPGNDGDKSESFGGYDAWVLKLDSDGNLLWEKSYGAAWKDRTNAIYRTPDGNYIIGGLSNSQNSGDIIGFWGGDDFWVFEIDDTGTLLDEKIYGGLRNDYLFSFYQTSDNKYLMTGQANSNDTDVWGNHTLVNDAFSSTSDFWVVKIGDMDAMDICSETDTAVFDLTTQTSVLQQSLPLGVITYYTTEVDAETNTNAIANINSFINTSNPQDIYIKIQTSTDRWHINHFQIEIVPAPQLATLPTLEVCGSNDMAVFDLTQQDALLVEGQPGVTVTYYTTAEEAATETNAVDTPASFSNTENPQTIFVVLDNGSCTAVTQFTIQVTTPPQLPDLPELKMCSETNTAVFDLTGQNTLLLTGQTGTTATYYTQAEDAASGINAITTPASFSNTENPQTIYVVVSGMGDCDATTSFALITLPVPDFVLPAQVNACSPANLTNFVVGANAGGWVIHYYESEADAQNQEHEIANPGNFYFTGSQTEVYVSAENSEGCMAVKPLEIVAETCIVPEGISPNGDNKNDAFDLSYFNVENIKIFNRYGTEVYSKNNYTNEWYGQSFNNKLLPTGVYYYIFETSRGVDTGWVYLNR